MKRSELLLSLIVLLAAAGTALTQTPPPTTKEKPDIQQQKGISTTISIPPNAKVTEGDNSRAADKAAPLSDKTKKARDLLNQCYQEALESDPDVKAGVLRSIAQAMTTIDVKRAMAIFETAFASTQEIQGPMAPAIRRSRQSAIVYLVASFDLEKALEMALQIEPMPGGGGQGDTPMAMTIAPEGGGPGASRAIALPPGVGGQADPRTTALTSIARRIAEKDPERAFGIVREEVARTSSVGSLVIPMALALQKKRPDLAEVLYLEAIRQFDKPVSDAFAFVSFVDMTASLFDLNRALTAQAVDVILKGIDYMADHPPSLDIRFESFDGTTRTTTNGIREYAVSKVLPLVRRLDPDRAKGLEEKFAASRALSPPLEGKTIGGIEQTSVPAMSPPAAASEGSSNPQNPSEPRRDVVLSSSSQTLIQRDAPPSSLPKPDPKLAQSIAARRASIETFQIAMQAGQDPKGALARLEAMAPGPDRIKATAMVAQSIFMTDPEKAKSLLSEAASATEKVSDPYDRAECDGVLAQGYLLFDQERAQQLIREAFTLANQVAEEENQRRPTPTTTPGVVPYYRSSSLFSSLLRTLVRLNIDDAIVRAQDIKDKGTKMRALIQVANAILTQK